jgi:hypothetical protein
LAAAISTLQAATAASREHAVGAATADGAPAGTTTGATTVARPHPPIDPPYITISTSTPAGAVDYLAAFGAPAGITAGTVTGYPPAGLLFLAVGANAPAGRAVGTARTLDAAATVGGPPQLSQAPPPGRPSTRPWADCCAG